MDQFKWVDVKGNQHSLTGNTCNTQIPAWTEQVNTITDKNSLPITKVMYGPLVHEAQSAKIIIGPIICKPNPLDEWSQVNMETHMKHLTEKTTGLDSKIENINETLDTRIGLLETKAESLETKTESLETRTGSLETKAGSLDSKINDKTMALQTDLGAELNDMNEKMEKNIEILDELKSYHDEDAKQLARCSSKNDGRFKLILGRCYFFDSTTKQFSSARDYCKTVFGQLSIGKLFEPMDSQTFRHVNETAFSSFGAADVWVGFERIGNPLGNDWKLVSNNAVPIQYQPWGTQWDGKQMHEAYLYFSTETDYWEPEQEDSSDTNPFICELTTIL